MSILERIRKRSGLLIGFVGVALTLFVVSDMLGTRRGWFGNVPTDIGEVRGEKIPYQVFDAKLEQNLENQKMNSQTESLDQNTIDMVKEQTWNAMVQEVILNEAYDKLGLTVGPDEVSDMVMGKDPHPSLKSAQLFQNQQTGQFDPKLFANYYNSIRQNPEAKEWTVWLNFEEGIRKERMSQKFTGMIKGGLYANSLEAKEMYLSRNNNVDIKFTGLNYSSISDSSVTLNDDDLKRYFDKNIAKFKNKENSRKLEFVVFDIFPSGDDSAATLRWANEQVERFRNTDNDSAFVIANSDAPFDTTWKLLNQLPGQAATLVGAPIGTTIGPIMEGGSYKIFKLSKVKEDSLYQMKASHILFKVENNDTAAAIRKAHEVLADIRKGASFEQKAAEFGTDGTAQRGGDLGWFTEGQMVKEFNDAVKRSSQGDMMVVKTQFGPHIIKVTENKTRKKFQLAVVERRIEPSNKTEQATYNVANQFAANSRDAESFDKNAAAANLAKRVADPLKVNDRNMGGVENTKEAIRWAFTAQKGEVSTVFDAMDKLIVAIVKEVREKDKASFEDVKSQVTEEARKEKKATMITEKIEKAMAESKDPVAIAVKLGVVANDAPGLTFENPNIPYLGNERYILGTAFGLKPNTLSEPLKGDNGVYVIMVTKVNESVLPKDLKQFRDEAKGPLRQRGEYEAMNALTEAADVVDNRFLFSN